MRLTPGPHQADRERGSVVAPVVLPALAEAVDVLDAQWQVKDEFHVTLVDSDWVAERLGLDPDATWEVVTAVAGRHAMRAVDLDPDDLRLLRKGEERTIVAMAVAHELPDFIAALGAELGTEVPLPPAHVTLYVRPGGKGVGIHDAAELEAITTPLQPEEVAAVRRLSGL